PFPWSRAQSSGHPHAPVSARQGWYASSSVACMPRPSISIMGGMLSTNQSSGPIICGDWRDRGLLYDSEARRHLPGQRDRCDYQKNGHDAGIVGGGRGCRPKPARQVSDAPGGAAHAVLRVQSYGKQSHLASLLPWAIGPTVESPYQMTPGARQAAGPGVVQAGGGWFQRRITASVCS